MFFFHEGLPRSGKSYEAVVKHIIPAIAKGRPVDAYIEGLNHDKIAELAGVTPERCRELLVQLTREDMPVVWTKTRDNALVCLDEMQNFWPNGRDKLKPEMIQFITEHGHRGQDILGMGQDMRDIHAMWRRRCAQKFVFVKLDGLGRQGNYSIRVHRAIGPDKWELVTQNFGKYEERFFGSYASHTAEDIQTGNYVDARTVIWNNWQFKWLLPVFGVLVLASGWALYRWIWGGELIATQEVHVAWKPPAAAAPVARLPPAVPAKVEADKPPPPPPPPRDYVQVVADKWRPRLSAYLEAGERRQVVVEFFDEAMRARERLDYAQLRSFGYEVNHLDGIVWLKRDEVEIIATAWPMESQGRVSAQTNREVAGLP